MKEYRLPLAQLQREEAELLPVRETLFGDITINTVIGLNFAFAIAALADRVNANAAQMIGVR